MRITIVLKNSLANPVTGSNQIPSLIEKIKLNQPLDIFDKEYPEYRKYSGLLLEVCAHFPTKTAKDVFQLLQQNDAIKNGNYKLWL